MKKDLKVIVAHPGKQHSFQLATALNNEGILFKYITSVYNKPGSVTSFLSKFFKGDILKKILGRRCENISDKDVIQFNEIGVLITLFLNKFPKINKFAEEWNCMIESNFYKKVMKYAKKNEVDAIVVYNGYQKKHFEILNKTKIIKIIDVSIAHREFLRDILDKEIKESGITEIKKQHLSYWNKHMIKNDIKGCSEADYFLAPSNFVLKSLVTHKVKREQVKIVPYGVDISQFNIIKNKEENGPLKLIYVGGISYRKGIHRLLEVIKEFDYSKVELYLAGTFDKNSDLYLNYKTKKNIHFLGFVTRDKLNKLYNEASIFVLPSFGEGLAQVGLEAMACGLPLLCTTNSGVNDVVIDGENGFVYEPNKNDELKNKIIWFINNREKIHEMGKKARITAEKYSWENYHKNVVTAIRQCIYEKNNK